MYVSKRHLRMSRKNEEKAAILETIIIIDFGYRERSKDCDAGSRVDVKSHPPA